MGTFSLISRTVFNISPRYFRWSPKIGFSEVDFEEFIKIRKFPKFSRYKILKILGRHLSGSRVFNKLINAKFLISVTKNYCTGLSLSVS